jgi:hypothetical protein
MSELVLQQRLRASAAMVIVGLLIEAFSLGWAHPTSFLVFVLIGGTFLAAGIGWFLLSLVSQGGK